MKKLLTALTAAVMLGSMLTAPVSAEETAAPVYKMGDVNMDGYIGADDAQLVLMDYLNVGLAGRFDRRVLTEEQLALGNVDLQMEYCICGVGEFETPLSAKDAQLILLYYADCLADPSVREQDIVEWGKQVVPGAYGLS